MERSTTFIATMAVVGLSACAMTAEGSDATLPQLGPSAALVVADAELVEAPDPGAQRWYVRHQAAIERQRDTIDAVIEGLTATDIVPSQIELCRLGSQMDDDASARAHDAVHAHPDWVRAVDLARWMFATCAGGDVDGVARIMPELTERLETFDVWRSTLTVPPQGLEP